MAKSIIKNLLVCVNGTKESVQAVMYAIILSKQFGFHVKAVNVIDTATVKLLSNSNFFTLDESISYEECLRSDGHRYLEYVESLAKLKGIKIQTELREGAVTTEIIRAAKEFEADLILIGGNDNGGNVLKAEQEKKSLRASLQALIVDGSPCSVLVVRKSEMESLFKIL